MGDARLSDREIFGNLHPKVSEWFRKKYGQFSPPQKEAIPRILEGKNVLICAPTGSGKTLSAFLGIISKLAELADEKNLEDKVYCVYISPLRAVANDIKKNLLKPLEEMGLDKKIRVAVRTGDTPSKEKSSMLKHVPHILITTPESFTLLLNSLRFQEKLKGLAYLILDEIHELCATKRGSLLSAEIELLQSLSQKFVRIGLSATQSPIEEIARFLGGYSGSKEREVVILNLASAKEYEIQIIYPPGLTNRTKEEGLEHIGRICADIVRRHSTVIIFTNTRKLTEEFVQVLRRLGVVAIDAHHGSLSRKRRLETEDALKKGELQAVVTSTSLELGIDIGSVDCVIQISSPKSISKAVQRFGRAGHTLSRKSKGYFISTSLQDFLECLAIVKKIEQRELDSIAIPQKPPDVLAQVLVGMGITRTWKVREAQSLLKNSYTYHSLRKSEIMEVLSLLSQSKRAIVDYDPKLEEFTTRRLGYAAFYENVGTIPREHNYQVFDEFGESIGTLSERFVEFLKPGDTFVLGGRVYEFIRRTSTRVFVVEAQEKRATIPSWVGELNARSTELSEALNSLYAQISDMDEGSLRKHIGTYLANSEALDEICEAIKRQREIGLPGSQQVLQEYIEENGKRATILLTNFGRRVNEALARYIAAKTPWKCEIIVEDNGFVLIGEERIEIEHMLEQEDFEKVVGEAIENSDIFHTKFKQCASRALLILNKVLGRRISHLKTSKRAEEMLIKAERKNPIYQEALREVRHLVDIENAGKIVKEIVSGKIKVVRGDNLSIFAIEMLTNLARDSGFLAEKLKRIKANAELKKYILEAKSLDIKFSKEEDALNFLKNFHSFWGFDPYLERLSERREVYTMFLLGRKVYLYPDLFAIYSDFVRESNPRHAKLLIEYFATLPFAPNEFAEMLGIEKSDLEKIIGEMLSEGALVPVIYNNEEKYLNASFLEFIFGKESEYISMQELRKRVAEATLGIEKLEDYFQNFICLREPYSLIARGIITAEEWESLAKGNQSEGKLIYGRFFGGRSGFVREEDLPLLQSLYALPLSEVDAGVLQMLAQPRTFSELRRLSGLKTKLLRGTLDKLEAAGLIRRERGETVKYLAVKPGLRENAEEECIHRLVSGFGCASAEFLSIYLNLPYERVHAIANNLCTKNKIKRAKIIGSERIVYLAEQKEIKKPARNLLLPIHDPFIETRWAEIASHYGEANLVYVEDCEPAAIINAESREGSLEVYEVRAKERTEGLEKWLIDYMKYRKDIAIRVHKISGSRQSLRDFFSSDGKWIYTQAQYYPRAFSFEEIFPKVLSLQGIPSGFSTTLEIVDNLFGLYNAEEARLRAKIFSEPEQLDGVYFVHSIPASGYHRIEQISILRAIRNFRATDEMKEMLKNLSEPRSEEELYALLPFSRRKFRSILNQLLKNNWVYTDAEGILHATPETSENALRLYIKQLLNSFGLVNPILIAEYTKNAVGKAEANQICKELATQGESLVGYPVKEMDMLFYIAPELAEAKDSKFTGVIPPEDRIVKFFSSVLKKIFGLSSPYLVVDGGKIRGFAEARKKGKEIHLENFEGDEKAWNIFREYLYAKDYLLRK